MKRKYFYKDFLPEMKIFSYRFYSRKEYISIYSFPQQYQIILLKMKAMVPQCSVILGSIILNENYYTKYLQTHFLPSPPQKKEEKNVVFTSFKGGGKGNITAAL